MAAPGRGTQSGGKRKNGGAVRLKRRGSERKPRRRRPRLRRPRRLRTATPAPVEAAATTTTTTSAPTTTTTTEPPDHDDHDRPIDHDHGRSLERNDRRRWILGARSHINDNNHRTGTDHDDDGANSYAGEPGLSGRWSIVVLGYVGCTPLRGQNTQGCGHVRVPEARRSLRWKVERSTGYPRARSAASRCT